MKKYLKQMTIMCIVWLFLTMAGLLSAQIDDTSQTLTLHGSLNSGLTSCEMQAGNGYDLAVLQASRPFAVEQVRFYAGSFQPGLSGPVTVTLYEDSDFQPQNGAQFLTESEPVTVNADKPTLYEVPFDEVRVTQPYLYAVLSFQAETVILASEEFVDGGYSFATDCDESGLANVRMQFSLNEIRLAIDVIGHPAGQAMETPEPSTTELTGSTSTQTATQSVTVTAPTTEPELTASATVAPTDTPAVTPSPGVTETPSPEATSELTPEATAEPEATVEVTPEATEEPESTAELTPEATEEADDA